MRQVSPLKTSPLAILLGALGGMLAAINAKIGLAAIGAVLLGILVFVGAELLLLAVVAVEPWADALAFPTASLTIPKIVGALAVFSWLLAAGTGRLRLRYAPQMGWGMLFVAVIVISLMLSPDPSTGTLRTVSYALYVTFLALFVQHIRGRQKVERCLAVYAASATGAAAVGFIRFATGAVHLASGPIGDPNDFAMFLACAIPMATYFAFTGKHRRLWTLALVVLAAAILATLSRGALVGFAAVLLWALLSRRISLPGVLTGGLAVAVVAGLALTFFQPLIQERLVQKSVVANKNVASRLVFWSAAWHMTLDHPVVGVGPSRFGPESEKYVLNDPVTLTNPAVHNSYLEILAEDGPFALALFLAYMASVWRALRKVRRDAMQRGEVRDRRLADALMASFVWTAVCMIFISKQLSIPVWLIGGMAASLALSLREARSVSTQAVSRLAPRVRPRIVVGDSTG